MAARPRAWPPGTTPSWKPSTPTTRGICCCCCGTSGGAASWRCSTRAPDIARSSVLPGPVATGALLSRDGTAVIISVEGPERPRELWHVDTRRTGGPGSTEAPPLLEAALVRPTLERFRGRDGWLTGWLYRPGPMRRAGQGDAHLHGGPEAQERPASAPAPGHCRGGNHGLRTQHPGFLGLRPCLRACRQRARASGAFADVLAAAYFLTDSRIADPDRIAVTGRSYGGYLTLVGLAFFPDVRRRRGHLRHVRPAHLLP